MKKALLIVLTALSAIGLVNEAGAADGRLIGSFQRAVDSAMLGYESEEKCVANAGRWIEGDCVFSAIDLVKTSVSADGVRLMIETVGLTGAMCEYEGAATFADEQTLVSSKPVQLWNGKSFEPATCEIAVRSLDGGAITVSTNGNCDAFCGARASLEIDKADRR